MKHLPFIKCKALTKTHIFDILEEITQTTEESSMAKEKESKGKKGGLLKEFKDFALKGNVMSMAVGVLIGGAFSSLVTSLTTNIITPLLNCIGKLDAQDTAKLAVKINGQTLEFGIFIADIINFIIMAFIIFMLVKGMNKLANLGHKEEEKPAPTTKKCPYCKSEIAIDAVRCPHCTSEVE